MNIFIVAQICGLLGAISNILSSWQASRKKILIFLIFDNLFYFLQYILLGAYSGAFSNIIGLSRNIMFKNHNYNEKKKSIFSLVLIIMFYLLIGFFTFDGLKSLFPIVASILYTCILYQKEASLIRIGSAFVLLLWAIYNFTVKAYVGMIVEIVLFFNSLIAFFKIDFIKYKLKKTSKSIINEGI